MTRCRNCGRPEVRSKGLSLCCACERYVQRNEGKARPPELIRRYLQRKAG